VAGVSATFAFRAPLRTTRSTPVAAVLAEAGDARYHQRTRLARHIAIARVS
jgi:hypothetical protein